MWQFVTIRCNKTYENVKCVVVNYKVLTTSSVLSLGWGIRCSVQRQTSSLNSIGWHGVDYRGGLGSIACISSTLYIGKVSIIHGRIARVTRWRGLGFIFCRSNRRIVLCIEKVSIVRGRIVRVTRWRVDYRGSITCRIVLCIEKVFIVHGRIARVTRWMVDYRGSITRRMRRCSVVRRKLRSTLCMERLS